MLYWLHALPSPVVVYPFRYRHELTGKWVRARYMADLNEIAERYAVWEITGPPETRTPICGTFSPHRSVAIRIEPVIIQPHLGKPPAIDAIECFLALLFLRRYVTYCARRQRYAAINGAAKLFTEIRAVEAALSTT